MKNLIWIASAAATAWATYLLLRQNSEQPVEVLVHRLEKAWADHHTQV